MFGTHTGLWVTEHDCGLPGSIGETKIITPSSSDSYLASKTLQPTYTFSVHCCMYVAVCVCVVQVWSKSYSTQVLLQRFSSWNHTVLPNVIL